MTKDELQWLRDVVVQGRAPLKFDTGGGDFGGLGDGAGQGGGYAGGTDTGPGGTDLGEEGSYGGAFDFASLDNMAAATSALGHIANQNLATPEGLAAAKGSLQTLQDLGLGSITGLYSNNPTSSVDNLLAVHNFSTYAAPALISLIPGSGFTSIARGLGALASGQTTLGQLAGQFAGQTARGIGASLISGATGAHPALVSMGLQAVLNNARDSTGQSPSSANTASASNFGGVDFAGVGGGSESYDPTQQLAASTRTYTPSQYGYNPNDLADVRAGLQKTPFGVMPYGDYYG